MKYRIFDGYSMSYQNSPSTEFPTMRSVGQLDSSKKEIYECDKVIMTPLHKDMPAICGVVEYVEKEDLFYVRHGANLARLDTEWHDIEVVGNAFEI